MDNGQIYINSIYQPSLTIFTRYYLFLWYRLNFLGKKRPNYKREANIECRLCHHMYKDELSLIAHLQKLHPKDPSIPDYIAELKERAKVQCKICGKTLGNKLVNWSMNMCVSVCVALFMLLVLLNFRFVAEIQL